MLYEADQLEPEFVADQLELQFVADQLELESTEVVLLELKQQDLVDH